MAFSDFKSIAEVQQQYQIRYDEADFIVSQPVPASDAFVAEFTFNRQYIDVFSSESARSEAIIFPILREVYKQFATDYALWIQKPFKFDQTLHGTPDYLLSTRSELGKTVVGLPMVMVVEAKRNDFEQGWGQCLAELYAAQQLNNAPSKPIYGIVTDGSLWQFGYLQDDLFTKNSTSFLLDQLPMLFGAIQFMFAAACGTVQTSTMM